MEMGDDKQQAPSDQAASRGGRGDRLAAALRSNLVKRKEQGRARRSAVAGANDAGTRCPPPQPSGEAEPAPHDSAEIITEKAADQAD
jgi:hypothetical protein